MVESCGTLPAAMSRSWPAQSVQAGATSSSAPAAARRTTVAAAVLAVVNEHLLGTGLREDGLHLVVAVPRGVGEDAEVPRGEGRVVHGRLGRPHVWNAAQHEERAHRAQRAEQ